MIEKGSAMNYADTIPFQIARDAGYSEEEAERMAAAIEAGDPRAARKYDEEVLPLALVNRERAAMTPGALLVVVGGLGIPSIARVEPDRTWMCVAGMFKGRPINASAEIRLICRDGDDFESWGVVRGGQLVTAEGGAH